MADVMRTLPFSASKLHTALCMTVLMSACSGSTSDDAGVMSGEQDAPVTQVGETAPIRSMATVVIAERSGKHIIDAYFSRTATPRRPDDNLWSNGDDMCARGIASDLSTFEDVTDVHVLDRAADRIEISDRSGSLISLYPQVAGHTVVYASDARWFTGPLPDDAVLSVAGAPGYTLIEPVSLTPVVALQRLSPESGQLESGNNTIGWVVDSRPASTISLQLTATTGGSSGTDAPALMRASCRLLDDGEFTVPDVVREALGRPHLITVSLTRYQEQLVQSPDSSIRILHSSQN